jgi:hypothetical protein
MPNVVSSDETTKITEGIIAGMRSAVAQALRNKVPLVLWRDGRTVEVPLSELEAHQEHTRHNEKNQ